MELQNFISSTENYIQRFKDLTLHVQKYTKLNVLLVKYKKDVSYDLQENPWIRYCRGAVIDTINHKVICIPPPKSDEIIDINEIIQKEDVSTHYEILIEGTMINMFYHQEEWRMSTRSSIGATNSWDGKMSFKDMVNEIIPFNFYDSLNKDHCYSFVLVHTRNRIVSPIHENSMFLVEQYQIKPHIESVKPEQIEGINEKTIISKDYLSNYQGDLYFSIKGFISKQGEIRSKWINPNYKYVLGLKMKFNDKFLNYIELRQKSLLTEYLRFFPEEKHIINVYRDSFNNMKQKLYDDYVSMFIRKEITINDIEYPLKPLVYELHSIYKKTKQKITFSTVSDFVHKMPSKKVLFTVSRMKLL
jgi:hypothetical protein